MAPVLFAISCDRFSQFRQAVRIEKDTTVGFEIRNDQAPANMFRQGGPRDI